MTLKPTLLAAAMALAALGAHAQTPAPGLWEHSIKPNTPGSAMAQMQSQLQAQLAAMPPDQRQKIEEMMKSRGVTMGAQGTLVKTCLTKEQAAKPPEAYLTGNCKQTEMKRSGNTLNYKFACTQPQPSTGEGHITYVGDKAYTGQATVAGQGDGVSPQMTIDVSGRWLAADCGDVKPRGAPSAP